ncbi:glucose-6-phosphate dehydrogenase [Priestia filamentosa]|uniref:Glucose-6-phosphate 1-dehydrogenase n=1 Tax=Priestia filamentosa TaxID=1402861 RepID=A0A1X7EJX4_9BACI|nr:glucose-6-phosphate dehydrogenase [Priestia filamentosa]AKO93016.1 glucose-6-phosphate dehydrogenase [Priestia filamentosa]MDT3763163.1 glucose-6-phosphate dehydrogenase [Priestia filamentosa]OXS69675.1 glucose-6-phosphate dehydrogenase [Priestia filamentosa]WCM14181.1 glucose-6-phosphate dehydrogenase [Priestia filamentosa]WRU93622.1 glucose-6-phosphate dehydrogenase [Priestia filamentosa]
MESMTFVLFGATGDLAKRKIFPALYNLFLDEKIPPSISIIGSGIEEMSDIDFQNGVRQSVETFSRRLINNHSKIEDFISSFCYKALDATNNKDYEDLLDLVQRREEELGIPENRMFYLSVAPDFFDLIALNIKESGLGSTKGWKRLIIEKPFGHDLTSAQDLNEKLSQAFKEDEIYRIDHYLGKSMVQNLEALEFANPILQSLWNNQHIANVQITASETVGVEKRADYYDQAGAIRDMVQNHMLQLVMMTAMHLPKKLSSHEIRDEKRKVMESLRSIKKEDVGLHIIRGQYDAGEIHGQPVVKYTDEPKIDSSSQNDTFVAARLWIDNSFWNGVPFYIRTGKRMKDKSTRIVIEFKNYLKDLYENQDETVEPNLLIIEINPHENVALQLNSKNPLKNGKIEPVRVEFAADQKGAPEAYERLIFDALTGDSTFFAHWKEVELAWEWIQPILEAFEENLLPLYLYSSGSYGPDEANHLLDEDGFKWWLDEEYVERKN